MILKHADLSLFCANVLIASLWVLFFIMFICFVFVV